MDAIDSDRPPNGPAAHRIIARSLFEPPPRFQRSAAPEKMGCLKVKSGTKPSGGSKVISLSTAADAPALLSEAPAAEDAADLDLVRAIAPTARGNTIGTALCSYQVVEPRTVV